MWKFVEKYYKKILVEKAQYNSCCFIVVKRSKYYNAVVSRQNIRIHLLLFLLFDVDFDVFTIFSELSGLKGNVFFMEIYILMKSAILSLTKYAIFYVKKK